MVKIELELSEQDASNLIAILIEHEENMKVQMNNFKSRQRPDGTWNRVDLANFEWYQWHVNYLENLRKQFVSGIKEI
jgi:hypothetical protein